MKLKRQFIPTEYDSEFFLYPTNLQTQGFRNILHHKIDLHSQFHLAFLIFEQTL